MLWYFNVGREIWGPLSFMPQNPWESHFSSTHQELDAQLLKRCIFGDLVGSGTTSLCSDVRSPLPHPARICVMLISGF